MPADLPSYPLVNHLDPSAHPDRPWWRATVYPSTGLGCWVRTDGVVVDGDNFAPPRPDESADVLAEIDTTNPLPRPPILCGQVWRFTHKDRLVIGVDQGDRGQAYIVEGMRIGAVHVSRFDRGRLLAGPYAPWWRI